MTAYHLSTCGEPCLIEAPGLAHVTIINGHVDDNDAATNWVTQCGAHDVSRYRSNRSAKLSQKPEYRAMLVSFGPDNLKTDATNVIFYNPWWSSLKWYWGRRDGSNAAISTDRAELSYFLMRNFQETAYTKTWPALVQTL